MHTQESVFASLSDDKVPFESILDRQGILFDQ